MPLWLLKAAPWLIGVAATAGILFGIHHVGYKAGYAASEALGWQQKAQGEEAARKAVQGQLAALQANLTHNDEVIRALHTQNAALDADRGHTHELVKRLLVQAGRAATSGHPLPEASSSSGTTDPGKAGQDGDLEGMVVEATVECQMNANQLDALLAEVKPQL